MQARKVQAPKRKHAPRRLRVNRRRGTAGTLRKRLRFLLFLRRVLPFLLSASGRSRRKHSITHKDVRVRRKQHRKALAGGLNRLKTQRHRRHKARQNLDDGEHGGHVQHRRHKTHRKRQGIPRRRSRSGTEDLSGPRTAGSPAAALPSFEGEDWEAFAGGLNRRRTLDEASERKKGKNKEEEIESEEEKGEGIPPEETLEEMEEDVEKLFGKTKNVTTVLQKSQSLLPIFFQKISLSPKTPGKRGGQSGQGTWTTLWKLLTQPIELPQIELPRIALSGGGKPAGKILHAAPKEHVTRKEEGGAAEGLEGVGLFGEEGTEVIADTSRDAVSAPAPAKELPAPLRGHKGERKEQEKEKTKEPTKEDLAALKEVEDDVQPERKKENTQASAPAKPKEQEMKPEAPVNKPVIRRKGGLQQFFLAISHFGLGKERHIFVQSLATMLNAGLPLVDALRVLQKEAHSRAMRKIVLRITDAVENGSPLWRAMEDQQLFSPHALSLVRIGEEAGDLAENMEYLAVQEEKDHALRQKVKMAMIYPSIVIVLMIVIVVGLGLFVLPNLIQVLYSLNVELPLVTRLLIKFTNAFTAHAATALPTAALGFFVFIILAKFTPLRVVTQWVLFHIPGVGTLAKEATIARFGVILGGLLKAGVPLVEAIHSLAEVTPIVAYRHFYVKLLDHISAGDSFSKSFGEIRRSTRLLPPSVQQLITTGERSGALSEILLKVADIYEKKANETAQKLPIVLEPMILLVIGGLVATIAFAIIIPIYSIVGSVGRQ